MPSASERPVANPEKPVLEKFGDVPVTGIGERPSESGLSDLRAVVRDETTGMISEYTADELDNKILSTLFDLWDVSDNNDFIGTADVIDALDKNVHVVALYHPSKALLSAVGVPGASFWSSIIQEAPLEIIDKPLGMIKQGIEIGGVIVGVLTGHLPLAAACFKAWLHDEVHSISVTAIEHLIDGDHTSRAYGDKLQLATNHLAHNAGSTAHSFRDSTAITEAMRRREEQEWIARVLREQAGRAAWERAERAQRERTARAEEKWFRVLLEGTGRADWERTERAQRERTARAEQEWLRVLREEAGRGEGERAERAERERAARAEQEWFQVLQEGASRGEGERSARAEQQAIVGLGNGIQEGREASNSAGPLQKPKKRLDLQDERLDSFKFVRLRIHYDSARPAVLVNDVSQPASPTRLVVVRDSGYVFLPSTRPQPAGAASTNASRGESGKFIVTNQECQLWASTNARGFAWDLQSAAVLQRNLRRTLLGIPLDLTTGITVEPIPVKSIDLYMNTTRICIEVIGIFDAAPSTEPKVACLGFKSPTRDEFSCIVISAVEKLVAKPPK